MNGEFRHHHNHHTMIFNHHLCFSTCIGIVLIVVPFPRNDKHESRTEQKAVFSHEWRCDDDVVNFSLFSTRSISVL